jgi:tetratricopeptide (TPR) repeat protein
MTLRPSPRRNPGLLWRSGSNRAIAIGAIAILFFPGAIASAQQSQEWERCIGGGSPNVRIEACTAVIHSGSQTKWNLGVAFYKRGSAYNDKGEPDSAIADFNEAVKRGLYIADVLNNRGISHSMKSDPDHAIADFNEAIRLNPYLSGAVNNRGNAFYQKGDYNRAIADYNEAIRVDPSNAEAFNNRCSARAILGQLQLALNDCNESLRLQPNNAEFLDSRGFTYLKLGQNDNAIKDYNEALNQFPQKAHSLYGRGIAEVKKGQTSVGESDIAAAKQVNSSIAEEFANRGVPPAVMRSAAHGAVSSTPASAPTVKELFDRYGLLGIFAQDCSKPASEQNQYVVHRSNSDFIQRDNMTGASVRSEAILIDSGTELRPNELSLGWTDEHGRISAIMRIASGRWRLMESTRDNGEKLISGGRTMQGAGSESAWLKKCD